MLAMLLPRMALQAAVACVWVCALVVLSVCCGSAARAALVVLCAAVAWHLSVIHVVSVPCACQVLRRSDDELMLLLVLLLRVHSIAATIANALLSPRSRAVLVPPPPCCPGRWAFEAMPCCVVH